LPHPPPRIQRGKNNNPSPLPSPPPPLPLQVAKGVGEATPLTPPYPSLWAGEGRGGNLEEEGEGWERQLSPTLPLPRIQRQLGGVREATW